jgi:hypothetical protein
MVFLEMSRVETHGGGTWAFPNCIWSPSRKENGSRWPFWEKLLEVNEGDVVIHLRGKRPNAYFVGFSIAAGAGFETSKRPPDAGEWAFATTFYRADLRDYNAFHAPINLDVVFVDRRTELEDYFDANRELIDKKRVFYVRQSGRLQCLNGAYLSELDDELLAALFGASGIGTNAGEVTPAVSVETGIQIRSIRARLGQSRFSDSIKRLYENKCCFPGCEIDDSRFVIAAHIARWSDNETLRGDLRNGLCLCLFHDKAFELGMFTLDERHRVFVNPRELVNHSTVVDALRPFNRMEIRRATIAPLADALLEHWIRCDLDPQ